MLPVQSLHRHAVGLLQARDPLLQLHQTAQRDRRGVPAKTLCCCPRPQQPCSSGSRSTQLPWWSKAPALTALWLLSEHPALAEQASSDFSKGSYRIESYWASLGLFLISLPGMSTTHSLSQAVSSAYDTLQGCRQFCACGRGCERAFAVLQGLCISPRNKSAVPAGLWSQVKRAPKAKRKRKTYEVDGPGRPGAVPLDNRARNIFEYFKKYNYEVVGTGEVITFAGTYRASKAQAAALVFYVFCGRSDLHASWSLLCLSRQTLLLVVPYPAPS